MKINSGMKMMFLTSWPHGVLKPVNIIEKHPTIKNGWYIRYEGGGTDTTTPDFLFEKPLSNKFSGQYVEDLATKEAVFQMLATLSPMEKITVIKDCHQNSKTVGFFLDMAHPHFHEGNIGHYIMTRLAEKS